MSRSFCNYDQDSDTFSVTVKREGVATCYRCPGSYIRRRFDYQAPLNGEALSTAIQFFVTANKSTIQ